MYVNLCELMKFAIRSVVAIAVVCATAIELHAENAETRILRSQIIGSGFIASTKMYVNPDEKLVIPGKTIFESNRLSLNGDISCKTCHLEKFGSVDGIPLGAAIGGSETEGPQRALSKAKFLPRNTLALWGRGAKDFKNFFWDGRVEFSQERQRSPFGSNSPSDDMMVTAMHLPVVEIREMLDEDKFVRAHKKESVASAAAVFDRVAKNLKKEEPEASKRLASALGKSVEGLQFLDYARAIAAHIRSEFRVRETPLERFVQGKETLTPDQVRGGLIFYGKGGCTTCHSGPHFSDFKFHVVAIPQLGFGKSGFGIDYGRYGATFDPADLYKFRTPPLYNVSKTGPFGHSGSLATLDEAVIAHFDPLRLIDVAKISPLERHEFYKRLALGSNSAISVGFLSNTDVRQVVRFLEALNF